MNGKNLAWAVQPQPIMYLIDCDGMVPQQPAPKAGVQAMGWTDPRVVERRIPAHDHYSDWYALALAMYRGLLLTPGKLDRAADGSWPPPQKIPNGFPARLADLVRRGLEPTAADRRPPPDAWVRALREIYLPNNRFDDAAIAALDAMSAPVKKTPPPTFTPLPATDWTTTVRPAPTAPATGRQPMNPPRQPPRPGPPPYQPPRTGPRYQGSPPPPYQNPRPGPPYPQPPPYRPPGTGPYYRQPAPPPYRASGTGPYYRQSAPPPYRTGPAMPPNPYQAPGYGPQYRQPGPPVGRVPTDPIAFAALRGGGRWYAFGVLAALFPIGGLTYTITGLVQLRHVDGAYPGAQRARMALIAFTVFYLLEMILLISLQALTRRT
ncbi:MULTISPECIES: hypothetical protein [Frankia]|uniref:Protein kinase domain-containing protein n=1 Tax=Frankia alni (strain DSM 45986 / CECT 9034 / ACN14a) TaxID=326424 RepID=Q0RFF9_FRAAA|nr:MULTISPECIES: hypothetical protein [Frankia]CAJ63785.1 hypothetical protein; putative Protein kinase domain; putative membrane protein [Frankia alni ACN14a]